MPSGQAVGATILPALAAAGHPQQSGPGRKRGTQFVVRYQNSTQPEHIAPIAGIRFAAHFQGTLPAETAELFPTCTRLPAEAQMCPTPLVKDGMLRSETPRLFLLV